MIAVRKEDGRLKTRLFLGGIEPMLRRLVMIQNKVYTTPTVSTIFSCDIQNCNTNFFYFYKQLRERLEILGMGTFN